MQKKIAAEKPVIGVSACLTGQKVRYNGSALRVTSPCQDLLACFELKSTCPEMAVGLGTPRQAIRLVGEKHREQALPSPTKSRSANAIAFDPNITSQLSQQADSFVEQNSALCGFILAQGSPSCGPFRVKRYSSNGQLLGNDTAGIFARRLQELLPYLPVEDHGRLNDSVLRENFVLRVYIYQEWQKLMKKSLKPHHLTDFYRHYKMQVLAHDQQAYRDIGRSLANLKGKDLHTVAQKTGERILTALQQKANRKGHSNVLQHLQGYLKRWLEPEEKRELSELIHSYRRGEVPLIVPMTLLRHHLQQYKHQPAIAYAHQQHYLNPYPQAMGLRNAI